MSLTLYKSSAGSGKTYTLAREYLRLSLRSPDYYRNILAVTFTNRAAEEMKERVIEFLIAISKGEHELTASFAEAYGEDEPAIQRRAESALKHILHHYGFFTITTIDTFFHRVIRAFSREIGLQGSFGIELDDKKVTELIANDLYTGVEEQENLKKWLVDFSMNRLRDGKGYDFKNEIKSLADQLFSEEFKKIPITQVNDETLKAKIRQLQEDLFKKKYNYERKLRKFGESFFEKLSTYGLEGKELSGGQRSIASFFRKLIERNYQSLINTTVEKCLADPSNWSSKTSTKRDLIVHAATESLQEMLQEAVHFINEEEKAYETSQAILRHLYTLGLLSDLSQRLQAYKQEEEVIMISDLSDFLNQIINDSDTPFIYEKVGSRFQHFFIDEFQDTSTFQWRNFKPLIEESLASGNENIIVGDVKQSIYRWRGGDASLLMEKLEDQLPTASTDASRNVNYRSAPEVVNFNNHLFESLPDVLQGLAEDRDFSNIRKAYDNVRQEVFERNKEVRGCVELKFLDKIPDESWNETSLHDTVQLIEKLYGEGHAFNEMAFLVRSNWEAVQIVNYVLDYKRNNETSIEVISAEGMLLVNSRVVQFLLNLYEYLLNPDDAVIEKNVIFQYNQVVLGLKDPKHSAFLQLTRERLPDKFKKYQQHFLHLPIYELTEVLIRLFKLDNLSAEYAYLQAFQDAQLEFGKNNPSDIRRFLDWWKDEAPRRSVQLTGALDAIEIITVHKSKGLQYPIVFVPFCNFQLDSRSHTSWYQSPDLQPFDQIEHVPVEYSSGLATTYFEDTYKQEIAGWYLESINILYVAFTRAERGLFVNCEKPSEKTRSWHNSASKLLWKYVETTPLEGWNSVTAIFQNGTLEVIPQKKTSGMVSLNHYVSYKWSDRLTVRKTGKAYFDDDKLASREEGILLHRILAEIIHWKDTQQVLDRYESRMEITSEDRTRFEGMITRLWKNEQVRSWFSGEGEVKTEVVVLPKDGEVKRMDRVILNGNKATVVDFKSGQPKKGDNKQLEEYVWLLKEMGYEAEGHLLYLSEGSVVGA